MLIYCINAKKLIPNYKRNPNDLFVLLFFILKLETISEQQPPHSGLRHFHQYPTSRRMLAIQSCFLVVDKQVCALVFPCSSNAFAHTQTNETLLSFQFKLLNLYKLNRYYTSKQFFILHINKMVLK
jgi:hypothetical protein